MELTKVINMPWYSIIYCLLLSLLGLAGAWDDKRCGQATLYVSAEVISFLLAIGLVSAFYGIGPLTSSLLLTLPVLLFVVVWNIYSSLHELRRIRGSGENDSQLSASENLWSDQIGVALALLLLLPAWFFGVAVCLRLI